ncbi:hypothetical protein [Planctomicrobium sp. SH664]|uniref:hypothetical protein n=1 Tax=Planctomicrobium sp. SH664 TaxID=3448125 RepID=UPI003F5B1512
MISNSRPTSLGMFLLILGLAAGCQQGETIERVPISGTVTYDGQPVQLGTIIFEPTADAGMTARASYMAVNNGVFVSGPNGPTSGEFLVRVSGFDKSKMKNPNDEEEDVPPLFPEYTMTVQVPVTGNKLDIVVPVRSKSK